MYLKRHWLCASIARFVFINILWYFQFSQRAPEAQAPRRAVVMSSPLLVTKQEIELSTMNPLGSSVHASADHGVDATSVSMHASAEPHINQLQQYGRTMTLAGIKGKSLKVKRSPRQFGAHATDGDTESDVAEPSRATFRAEFMPSTVKTRNTVV